MISVLFQFDRCISINCLTTNINEKEIRKSELSYSIFRRSNGYLVVDVCHTGVNNSLVFVYGAVRSSDNEIVLLRK